MSVVKVLYNAHFYKVFDKGTVFCSGFVIQCQGCTWCTCAGWLWEGEGGLGDHQPGVYVPLKALFLVSILVQEYNYLEACEVSCKSYIQLVMFPFKTITHSKCTYK